MNLLNIKNYIVVAFIAVAIGAWGGVEWEHNANEALAKIAMEESIVAHAEVTKKDGDVLHNAEAEKTELVTAFRTLRTEELTDNESSDCNLTVNEYDNFARLFNAASEAANARIAVKLMVGCQLMPVIKKKKSAQTLSCLKALNGVVTTYRGVAEDYARCAINHSCLVEYLKTHNKMMLKARSDSGFFICIDRRNKYKCRILFFR